MKSRTQGLKKVLEIGICLFFSWRWFHLLPIIIECGQVLLPLVNVPMIDYTLEWLASAGVEECFVFCCAHANQITSHLNKSPWMSQPDFTVSIIESHDCVSAGDALRVIEQRGVVYLSIPHQCIYSIHRVAQKRITRLIHFP
jgi:translation initiation factor eIF-2B subunit epsilon